MDVTGGVLWKSQTFSQFRNSVSGWKVTFFGISRKTGKLAGVLRQAVRSTKGLLVGVGWRVQNEDNVDAGKAGSNAKLQWD